MKQEQFLEYLPQITIHRYNFHTFHRVRYMMFINYTITLQSVIKPACSLIQEEETIPHFVKEIENRYYTVKLEIKRPNIEQKSFTYIATGIYENRNDCSSSHIDQSQMTDQMEQSITQVTSINFLMSKWIAKGKEYSNLYYGLQASGSSYHLDDFSQLQFQTPEVTMKKKKKRSLTNIRS